MSGRILVPQPRIEPVPPALGARVLTTEPSRKSLVIVLYTVATTGHPAIRTTNLKGWNQMDVQTITIFTIINTIL